MDVVEEGGLLCISHKDSFLNFLPGFFDSRPKYVGQDYNKLPKNHIFVLHNGGDDLPLLNYLKEKGLEDYAQRVYLWLGDGPEKEDLENSGVPPIPGKNKKKLDLFDMINPFRIDLKSKGNYKTKVAYGGYIIPKSRFDRYLEYIETASKKTEKAPRSFLDTKSNPDEHYYPAPERAGRCGFKRYRPVKPCTMESETIDAEVMPEKKKMSPDEIRLRSWLNDLKKTGYLEKICENPEEGICIKYSRHVNNIHTHHKKLLVSKKSKNGLDRLQKLALRQGREVSGSPDIYVHGEDVEITPAASSLIASYAREWGILA